MNRAWSELSRSGLASALQPVAHDFWLVTELLLARYGIAREIDPDLAPQARRDLVRRLDPALAFGLRRVPALLFRARVHLMEGEPHRARALLAELDALRTHSLVEQGEGAVGRLDHPRWRLEGLRLYRELAGPDLAPEARADLDARITDLEAR
jgi:hypothetical protein